MPVQERPVIGNNDVEEEIASATAATNGQFEIIDLPTPQLGQANIDNVPQEQQPIVDDLDSTTDTNVEPLFPIPDLTPSILEINQSLNSIQEDITQLTLRVPLNLDTLHQIETENENGNISNTIIQEEDEDFNLSEYDDLNRNLDTINEALSKLDQENSLLQNRLRELLSTIRENNQQQSGDNIQQTT